MDVHHPTTRSLEAKAKPGGWIARLLRHAHAQPPGTAARAEADSDSAWEHLAAAGLAPMLHHSKRCGVLQPPDAWGDRLLAAALTARVRHGAMVDCTLEIIDSASALGIPITLLKGISISEQFYPVPYLRPMGDVDVLVDSSDYSALEKSLLTRGYGHYPHYDQRADAHHGVPLVHAAHRVVVEIHTALFPDKDPLRRNDVFSPGHVAAQSVDAQFHGRTVRRLTPEMQLAYVAASWLRNLTRSGFHPSLVPALFDAVYLLDATGSSLEHDVLLGWLDNEFATCALYILLAYIDRLGLDGSSKAMLPHLRTRQDRVGPMEMRLIAAMLDSYLVEGEPYHWWFNDWHAKLTLDALITTTPAPLKFGLIARNIALPPGVEKGHRIAYQIDRIARLLGRAR
jgi:hypothetical protein